MKKTERREEVETPSKFKDIVVNTYPSEPEPRNSMIIRSKEKSPSKDKEVRRNPYQMKGGIS